MKSICSLGILLARWCIAAVFLYGGISKFIAYDFTREYMASKGFTNIPIFLFGAALVEILGALSIIFGFRARFGALILMLFLIPATYIFHDFWNASGVDQTIQMIHFLKNLAIFGGLLYIFSAGPGSCACDAFCCSSKKPEEKT